MKVRVLIFLAEYWGGEESRCFYAMELFIVYKLLGTCPLCDENIRGFRQYLKIQKINKNILWLKQ